VQVRGDCGDWDVQSIVLLRPVRSMSPLHFSPLTRTRLTPETVGRPHCTSRIFYIIGIIYTRSFLPGYLRRATALGGRGIPLGAPIPHRRGLEYWSPCFPQSLNPGTSSQNSRSQGSRLNDRSSSSMMRHDMPPAVPQPIAEARACANKQIQLRPLLRVQGSTTTQALHAD
jgi:hypothetical protein